jgi:hypothetical protein
MKLGQSSIKMILVDRYDYRIYFGRRETMLKRNRIISIVEITQILIFEFECLRSGSRNLGSDTTG